MGRGNKSLKIVQDEAPNHIEKILATPMRKNNTDITGIN